MRSCVDISACQPLRGPVCWFRVWKIIFWIWPCALGGPWGGRCCCCCCCCLCCIICPPMPICSGWDFSAGIWALSVWNLSACQLSSGGCCGHAATLRILFLPRTVSWHVVSWFLRARVDPNGGYWQPGCKHRRRWEWVASCSSRSSLVSNPAVARGHEGKRQVYAEVRNSLLKSSSSSGVTPGKSWMRRSDLMVAW